MNSLYFLYHELRPIPSSYSYVTECSEFDRQCALFTCLRHDPESLRPEVTFDDGHRSNHEFALPILEQHGIKAHFFITAGWTGQRADYMGWPELQALHRAGHVIGAHGWSHKLLTHCTPQELDHELAGARQTLQDRLGAPVTKMSLPGGRANPRVLEACWKSGYTEVFTSVPQAVSATRVARVTVGRVNVRSAMTRDTLANLLHSGTGELARMARQERLKSAAKAIMGDRMYATLWSLVNRQEPETDAAGAAAK